MQVQEFFDERTSTLTYVVYDASTRDAVIIDPVLDYDAAASRVWTESAERVARFVDEQALRLRYILETHAHADHLSGSQELKRRYPAALIAIGARIREVQQVFKRIFDLPDAFPTDGRQFDRLLDDDETLVAGSLRFRVLYTPGHTPACASYHVDDAVFVGDALFMPDQGTGRCDFPAGSARDLYHSVTRRLYRLPDGTRVFVGHDYQPGGREVRCQTTIGEQKQHNVQLPASIAEQEFVRRRTARDATLPAPKLLFQSVQVNIDAGALPPPSRNDIRYLRIPINVFRPEAAGAIELKPV